MSFAASESVIVHGFQAFYYELLRQKEKALSLHFTPGISDTSDIYEYPESNELKTRNEIEGSVVEIQKRLLTIIENVSDTMVMKSRGNPRFINDAKYIMAILTDEIFLNLQWEGAKFWRYTLLEKQIFHTEIAGDRFFLMLDEIITDLNNKEVAFLYLMALSLGFKGRYRDIQNSNEHLEWYKDRLYSMLHTESSRLFFPGRSHMIESCYEYTYSETNNTGLPDFSFWSWCLIAVIFLYIIISYFVWKDITYDVSEILDRISEQMRQGPLI
ncbi:MAG: DotU family type IV/VI secretion system protein [Holosporales bacterium]|jgi:type VI secretion system protein ImpK|nr:DotU family type IV/VI secretion system protein [Holosporales bacterium]